MLSVNTIIGRKVLEVAVVKQNGRPWSLPGGFVVQDELVVEAVRRCFQEEAMCSNLDTAETAEKAKEMASTELAKLFSKVRSRR